MGVPIHYESKTMQQGRINATVNLIIHLIVAYVIKSIAIQ